jgi:hypothetical protein
MDDHPQTPFSGGGFASPAITSPRDTQFTDDSCCSERSALDTQARTASSAMLGGELLMFRDHVKDAPASSRAADSLQVSLHLNQAFVEMNARSFDAQ